MVVFSQLSGLILLLAALPLLPRSSVTIADFGWGAAAGLAGGIGVALLYRALSAGVMSVIAPVTAVCAVIVPLLAGMLLGERPSVRAMIGVLLAVVAIVLVSQSGEKRAATAVSLAIASGVCIGVFLVFLARSGSSAGQWPLIAARIVSVALFALLAVMKRQRIMPDRASMPLVIGGGALDMLANVLYVLAVRRGLLSIVATLTSLYPTSTIILARIILGERLRALQQAGVACAGAAIVLIVTG